MVPISLFDARKVWIDQGIGHWRDPFDFDLTDECREWLRANIRNDWWWDYFAEEAEVSMYFMDPQDAILFKLTWL